MTRWIEFLGDDAIYAMGWTFVHSLWQGSLLALVMMFAISRVPASNAVARYRIAFGSLASMLAMAFGTFMILYKSASGPAIGMGAQLESASVAVTASSGFTQWLDANLGVLVAIWIVGMCILLVRMGVGLIYIERLKRSSTYVGKRIEAYGEQIAQQLKYKQSIRIAQSALVNIPVVVGFIKPVILFPIGAVNQLSTDEVQAVLAHELAHLVRNDFIQNIIQSLIEIVFYYHPAVWWISAVVRSERENCCDDLAIKACGSSLTYAKALVHLQDMGHTSPALALPFSGSKHHLLNRVKRILNQPQNKSNVMEKITATGLLVLCLIFASFSGNADSEDMVDNIANLHSENFHFEYALTDTVPPAPLAGKVIVHKASNGKEVELVYQNGEVKSFKVDGVEVEPAEYGKHQEVIDELIEEAHNIPAPPAPPAPPSPPLPDVAPMPPVPPVSPTAPDAPFPPTPGKVKAPDLPPSPPPAPTIKKRTETLIIREVDEDGNKVYRIESDGEGKNNIVINEASSIALIDGQEVIIDADSIIVIEEVETTMPFAQFWVQDDLAGAVKQYKIKGENFFEVAPQVGNIAKFKDLYAVMPDNLDASKQYIQALKLYNESADGKELEEYLIEYKLGYDDAVKAYSDQLKDYNIEWKEHEGAVKAYSDQLKEYNFEWKEDEGAWKVYNELKDHPNEWRDADHGAAKAQIAKRLKESERAYGRARIHTRDANRLHSVEEGDSGAPMVFSTPSVEMVFPPVDTDFAFYNPFSGNNGRIVGEMAREGLIDPDGEFSVVLSEKKLKVNGKRMPDTTLEKYKKIFEKTYGHSISGKTKIELSNG